MLKPASMTFEQIAAVPQAAVVALQGLRDKGHIRAGQRVLINGAGGGTGTFAIQIAKSLGAHVTGVDRTSKLELMRSIGADHVIDYTKEDPVRARKGQRYDLVLDLVAHRSIFSWNRALNPMGKYVLVGGSMTQLLLTFFMGPLFSIIGGKKMGVLAAKQNKREDLVHIQDLIESGRVEPIIDRQFRLSEVPEALRYLGEGCALGKVVITM
jgi:NADPH:quinone reductase-like Zn-dependent oxidoreductase